MLNNFQRFRKFIIDLNSSFNDEIKSLSKIHLKAAVRNVHHDQCTKQEELEYLLPEKHHYPVLV